MLCSGELDPLKSTKLTVSGVVQTQAGESLLNNEVKAIPTLRHSFYWSSVLVYRYLYFKCPENFILGTVLFGAVCNTGQGLRGFAWFICCTGANVLWWSGLQVKIFRPNPNYGQGDNRVNFLDLDSPESGQTMYKTGLPLSEVSDAVQWIYVDYLLYWLILCTVSLELFGIRARKLTLFQC